MVGPKYSSMGSTMGIAFFLRPYIVYFFVIKKHHKLCHPHKINDHRHKFNNFGLKNQSLFSRAFYFLHLFFLFYNCLSYDITCLIFLYLSFFISHDNTCPTRTLQFHFGHLANSIRFWNTNFFLVHKIISHRTLEMCRE